MNGAVQSRPAAPIVHFGKALALEHGKSRSTPHAAGATGDNGFFGQARNSTAQLIERDVDRSFDVPGSELAFGAHIDNNRAFSEQFLVVYAGAARQPLFSAIPHQIKEFEGNERPAKILRLCTLRPVD